MKLKKVLLLFISLIFWNCATTVPISTSLNDFAMMGINSSEIPVSYQLKNELKNQINTQAGILKPYKKDKGGMISSMPGYKMVPENIFSSMFKEFLSNKYTNISETNADNKIEIILKDFWIEYYTEQGGGTQFAIAMVGGEMNYTIKARVKILVKQTANGKENFKNISSSAEELFVYGIGTGTSSSNIYKGANSAEATVGKVTNSVFNKAIMMTDKFLSNPADIDKKAVSNSNSYDDLKNLKSLMDDGIITKEEFEAKKKQILGL